MRISQVRRQREKFRITQNELSRASEVPPTRICLLERGHVEPRPREIEALLAGIRAILRTRARQANAALEQGGCEAR